MGGGWDGGVTENGGDTSTGATALSQEFQTESVGGGSAAKGEGDESEWALEGGQAEGGARVSQADLARLIELGSQELLAHLSAQEMRQVARRLRTVDERKPIV